MATKAVPVFLHVSNQKEDGGFLRGKSNEIEAVLQQQQQHANNIIKRQKENGGFLRGRSHAIEAGGDTTIIVPSNPNE
eukprot:906513-Ditylum_brightwellii.AAC.1